MSDVSVLPNVLLNLPYSSNANMIIRFGEFQRFNRITCILSTQTIKPLLIR